MERGVQTSHKQNTKQVNDNDITETRRIKTANSTEMLKLMLDQLIPEDNPQNGTDHHKTVRRRTEQPLYTMDDKEFTQDEFRQVIERFKSMKGP
jgi:hypothetical protein